MRLGSLPEKAGISTTFPHFNLQHFFPAALLSAECDGMSRLRHHGDVNAPPPISSSPILMLLRNTALA